MWAGNGRLKPDLFEVVEWPEPKGKLLLSRRKEYEPAIVLVREKAQSFFTSKHAVRAATEWTEKNRRMRGVFTEEAAYREMMFDVDRIRAPQGIDPRFPLERIAQDDLHPLTRYYSFPGVVGRRHSTLVRQLKIEERHVILRYCFNDFAKEGVLKKQRKEFGWGFSVLPSPHGEEAPPHFP